MSEQGKKSQAVSKEDSSNKQSSGNYQPQRRGMPVKKAGKGNDRRLKVRGRSFEDNMHKKAEGIEIPKTKKVSRRI